MRVNFVARRCRTATTQLLGLVDETTRLAHDLRMPDGRSLVHAIEDLIERVKELEHDAKPIIDGGPALPP